jgi:hypothetical protein
VVGDAVDGERRSSNGDSLQKTSTGLMVWRKADNWTAFTNGDHTWVNGPQGVQERANGERFEWEKESAPTQGSLQPTEDPTAVAPAATPAPSTALPSTNPVPPIAAPSAPPLPATLKVSIDKPVEGTHVGYRLQVTGWAVSTDAADRQWSGVQEFKAYLDAPEGSGKALTMGVNRLSRPDVGTALGNSAFSNSGFALTFNRAEIPAGRHTLYLYLRSVTSGWWWKPITFISGYDGTWWLYDRSTDGFQLSLPPGWAAIDLTARDLVGQYRRAFEDNPEVRAKATSLALESSLMGMMGCLFVAVPAAEATLPDALATHIKLFAPPMDAPTTLDEAGQLFMKQLSAQARAGLVNSVSQRRVALPAGDAVEFIYIYTSSLPSGSKEGLAVLDYAILQQETLYEVVCTCPADRLEEFRPLFDVAVRSLSFVGPTAPGSGV